jgi:hypothetical protein
MDEGKTVFENTVHPIITDRQSRGIGGHREASSYPFCDIVSAPSQPRIPFAYCSSLRLVPLFQIV